MGREISSASCSSLVSVRLFTVTAKPASDRYPAESLARRTGVELAGATQRQANVTAHLDREGTENGCRHVIDVHEGTQFGTSPQAR
jgi:hypothetical protein